MEDMKCEECGKSFSRLYCLRRHYENIHIKKEKRVHATSYTCDKCHKCVPSRQAFNKHWQRNHAIKSKSKTQQQRCPICKLDVHYAQVHNHFSYQHQIELKETTHSFPNEKEFVKWKELIEKSTDSKFIIRVTRKNRTVRKYVCHRSGHFNSTSKNIRNPKVSGSKKINGICPASMHFTKYNDEQVSVKFIETHVGHYCDYEHLIIEEIKVRPNVYPNEETTSEFDNSVNKTYMSHDYDDKHVIITEIQNYKNFCTNEEITSKFNNILKKIEKSESARIYFSNMLSDAEVEINLLLQR